MKKMVLALAICLALGGCSSHSKTADKTPKTEPKPVESLLAPQDMTACEQQLGVVPPKTASDVYVLSADSLDRVKDCAFGVEKQHMPLLADLIDKYKLMLQQGNKECDRDIGTHYAEVCMKKNKSDAANWYNLAVSQRLMSEMPNQPQTPTPPAPLKP